MAGPTAKPRKPASASAVVEHFLEHGINSDHSRRTYRGAWARWCAWLEGRRVALLAATAGDVQAYVNQMSVDGRSRDTRMWHLAVLRSVYGALAVAGLVASNPAREARNPK